MLRRLIKKTRILLRNTILGRTITSERNLALEIAAQTVEDRPVPNGTTIGALLADIAQDLRAMKSNESRL